VQATRDAVDRHTAQLRALHTYDWETQHVFDGDPGPVLTTALQQLTSKAELARYFVGDWAWGELDTGGLAQLLQRLGGSLDALALPVPALAALAEHIQQQQLQQQQPGGPQGQPLVAAQLTRLSTMQLVGLPEVTQPTEWATWVQLHAGAWGFLRALPALRHLHAWAVGADMRDMPAQLETLVLRRPNPTTSFGAITYPPAVLALDGIERLASLRGLSLHGWGLRLEQLAPLSGCASYLTLLNVSCNDLIALGPIARLTSMTGACQQATNRVGV
jgi:hypothetical protein